MVDNELSESNGSGGASHSPPTLSMAGSTSLLTTAGRRRYFGIIDSGVHLNLTKLYAEN